MPRPAKRPVAPAKNRSGTQTTPAPAREQESTVAGVRITNPDRVLYPELGITKLDVAKFYEAIAQWILPYLVGRPLTMVRCPQGQVGKCFYQKHMKDSLPDTLRGVSIREKQGSDEYVVLDDLPGLISLVQIGVLEFHPWPARSERIESPDQMIFDLDPGPGVAWADVVSAARDVRRHLDQHHIDSYVRTSGGKGLHVVAPLKPPSSWDQVKQFTRSVAEEMVREDPQRYVATMSKSKRGGKVFVDYFRNSRGATAIASYSTRARSGAPVATPLRWEELARVESADHFDMTNLVRRLARLRTDPWDGFFKLRQSIRVR
jgi:bifunctional non-homologous end joining protein LigD